MFLRTVSVLHQLGIRKSSGKAAEVIHNLSAKIPPSPELSALPPAPHLRSLQASGRKIEIRELY